jgi:diadenosine tetraphosphatase ApaH/serine/threonine PP2A family protein phosphatase
MFSDESFAATFSANDCDFFAGQTKSALFPPQIEELIENIKGSIISGMALDPDMYQEGIDFLDGKIQSLFESHTNIYVVGTGIVESIKTIGDTHGSTDLLEILNSLTLDDDHHVIIMGDLVDRGRFSLENMLLVLFLKLRFPAYVHVLRGNHEDENICSSYGTCGFKYECQQKIRSKFQVYWKRLMDFFAYMPLACIANGYFYVHGGLPMGKGGKILDFPTVNTIDRKKYRTLPSPIDDLSQCFVQMLWGDPSENFGTSARGGDTYVFSAENTKQFFEVYKEFNIMCVIRAHEVQQDGYVVNHFDDVTKEPMTMTVFSASRYCGMKNKGAYGVVSAEGVIGMCTYESSVDLRAKEQGDCEEDDITPRCRQLGEEKI